MHKRFVRAGALLLLITALVSASDNALKAPPKNALPVHLDVFNFDHDVPGKPPEGFSPAVVGEEPEILWRVKQDLHPLSAPNVLVQEGKGESGDNAALMLWNGRAMEHGEASVQFKIMNTEGDQSAGLVWRYKDPRNFYLVVASAQDESCSVYRVKNGKRKLLDEKAAVITPYTWHELRVVFVQNNFSVFVNTDLTAGGKDSGLQGAGQVGFGTLGDSAAQFDDFNVSKPTDSAP